MLPSRASINPADFSHLLPQIFMAGCTSGGPYHLRLVGGFVAELHGGDLRAENLLNLWDQQDRGPLRRALEDARQRRHPLVVSSTATTACGLAMTLEVVMAPLCGPSAEPDRLIGLYQPTSPVAALRGRPVRYLSARAIRSAATYRAGADHLRLACVDGRLIA